MKTALFFFLSKQKEKKIEEKRNGRECSLLLIGAKLYVFRNILCFFIFIIIIFFKFVLFLIIFFRRGVCEIAQIQQNI